jgi:hypothetical protein
MLFVPCFTAVFMVYNLPKPVANGKDFRGFSLMTLRRSGKIGPV